MNDKNIKKISKFLSLILRHTPEKIDLVLDDNGWADVNELVLKANKGRFFLNKKDVENIVENNDKKRFSFNESRTKIRANQGHSLPKVNMEYINTKPPEFLFHGTVSRFLDSIKKDGLRKMSRQYVHLSKEIDTAVIVGSRRGKAIILKINSEKMFSQGYEFYCSKNQVWLTDYVASEFIDFNDEI